MRPISVLAFIAYASIGAEAAPVTPAASTVVVEARANGNAAQKTGKALELAGGITSVAGAPIVGVPLFLAGEVVRGKGKKDAAKNAKAGAAN